LHIVVFTGLDESAAARRVFFTGCGGAPTSCDWRRRQNGGGVSEQNEAIT